MLAKLWEHIDNNKVKCELCSHTCVIAQEKAGLCGVRVNKDGKLYSLVADKVAAVNIDPIEKKPLYHFYPATKTFSLGTEGCNMACAFCQNHDLSQNPKATGKVNGQLISPEILIKNVISTKSDSISFTYSEPTIFFELMYATAKLAKSRDIKTVLVSNGYQSKKCLELLDGYIDAANIDLKSFSNEFYKKLCKASLQPVLNTLKTIKSMGWWLEVTTLVIPNTNDSMSELQDIASFIYNELGAEVPWHISRFHAAYHFQKYPSTNVDTLIAAKKYGEGLGLKHVYIGNVAHGEYSCTFCPQCGKKCVHRDGYSIKNELIAGICPQCGYKLAGRW